MQRVFIIHGWGGKPSEAWFPWLASKLDYEGFIVKTLYMPLPDEPIIDNWVHHIALKVGEVDDQTYFVGYALGCQAILRYIESLPVGKKVGGAVFVAGSFNMLNLETEDERVTAEPWIKLPMNYEKIKQHLQKIVGIFSDNDPYVPLSEAELFKKRLNAKIRIEKHRRHYSAHNEITEVPEVLEEVLKIAPEEKYIKAETPKRAMLGSAKKSILPVVLIVLVLTFYAGYLNPNPTGMAVDYSTSVSRVPGTSVGFGAGFDDGQTSTGEGGVTLGKECGAYVSPACHPLDYLCEPLSEACDPDTCVCREWPGGGCHCNGPSAEVMSMELCGHRNAAVNAGRCEAYCPAGGKEGCKFAVYCDGRRGGPPKYYEGECKRTLR